MRNPGDKSVILSLNIGNVAGIQQTGKSGGLLNLIRMASG